MNFTPGHLIGATPTREPKPAPVLAPKTGRKGSKFWNKPAGLLKKGAAYLPQSSMLAFLAPLLQAEIGIHVWVTVLVCIALYVGALLYLVRHPRIHFWCSAVALLLSALLLLTLAVRPFYHMTGQTYVTVAEEGHSFFDPQRYVSAKVALPEGSRLVIANHPVHTGMAHLLSWLLPARPAAGAEGGMLRWLRGLTASHFDGRVIFLTPALRRGGTVVPLELSTRQREGWTDLSGASCTSYSLKFGKTGTAAYTLSLTSEGAGADGATRIGARLLMDLSSGEDAERMRFHLRTTPESIHWEDVVLYGGYDAAAATYVAMLAELLASPNLRHYWAAHSAELWQSAPNEREMLRLLLLKARLDSVSAKGNVLHAQLLPDLIRAETILAGSATGPESLAQDQLLYWAAKNFVKLNKVAVHRFERTAGSLRDSLAAAAAAVEPTFFNAGKDSGETMGKLLSRILPLNVWHMPSTRRYITQLEEEARRLDHMEPAPESKTLAWLKEAEWAHMRDALPDMGLKKAAPGMDKEEAKTAAAHAREPTLEEAWEQAEHACALEYLRRVLQKALGETDKHLLNARGLVNETVALDVAEAALLQRDLLEELLRLRQALLGDSVAYLADSRLVSTLRSASQAYATAPQGTALPDLSRVPAVSAWMSVADRAMQQPLLRRLLEEEVGLEEVSMASLIKEPLDWVTPQPRMARMLYALLSILPASTAPVDSLLQGSAPLQMWLRQVLNDPAMPPLVLRLVEDEQAATELVTKMQAHAAALPVPAATRAQIHQRMADLPPLLHTLRKLDFSDELDEQPVVAEAAGYGMLMLRDLCYDSSLMHEVGVLIDRSVFSDEFTVFDIFAPAEDAPAREFYTRMKASMRSRATDRRTPGLQTAADKRIWRFVNRITTLTNLPPDQQPVGIARHPESGKTTFFPPCPMLEEWIREVATSNSDPVAKSAYPAVAETLYLDLYLRTLEDATHSGYARTELGMPRQIFQSITKQSIEEYLADCFDSEETKDAR